MRLVERPSPNHGPRIGCPAPDMIVLHYTGMETAEAALDRLCDPGPEVSAHYLICQLGVVHRLVPEARRAWHAGQSHWRGERDINSRSIGIELANPGPLAAFPPFPEAQMTALEDLIADIRSRWQIPDARILGHSDVSPGRKADPGPKFDWARLVTMPDGNPASGVADLDAALIAIGYDPESGAHHRLDAFRLRFRQHAAGAPPGAADRALAGRILQAAD